MNSSTKKIFFIIAVVGFILGTLVHIISILEINLQKDLPFIWVLHLVVFVVFIPAVLELKKNKELNKRMNPIKQFKTMVKFFPKPLVILTAFFLFYTLFNFLFSMSLLQGGGPNIINGEYVLSNHGKILRTLTEVEYYKFQAHELRAFSGHWMLFFSVSITILFPQKNKY